MSLRWLYEVIKHLDSFCVAHPPAWGTCFIHSCQGCVSPCGCCSLREGVCWKVRTSSPSLWVWTGCVMRVSFVHILLDWRERPIFAQRPREVWGNMLSLARHVSKWKFCYRRREENKYQAVLSLLLLSGPGSEPTLPWFLDPHLPLASSVG